MQEIEDKGVSQYPLGSPGRQHLPLAHSRLHSVSRPPPIKAFSPTLLIVGAVLCMAEAQEQHPWALPTRCQQHPSQSQQSQMPPDVAACSLDGTPKLPPAERDWLTLITHPS